MGLSRPTGSMQPSVPAGSGSMVTGTGSGGHFLGSQPQAAIMKQMLIEQRAQLQVMEQQKQQFLREQRQQQQQQILAEQVQCPSVSNAFWDEQEHYRQCCISPAISLANITPVSNGGLDSHVGFWALDKLAMWFIEWQ